MCYLEVITAHMSGLLIFRIQHRKRGALNRSSLCKPGSKATLQLYLQVIWVQRRSSIMPDQCHKIYIVMHLTFFFSSGKGLWRWPGFLKQEYIFHWKCSYFSSQLLSGFPGVSTKHNWVLTWSKKQSSGYRCRALGLKSQLIDTYLHFGSVALRGIAIS